MKTNYLNNRDMLREIHRSKLSYSSFVTPSDRDYDIIVHDLKEIPQKIVEAKEVRALRIAQKNHEISVKENKQKTKLEDHKIDPLSISDSELVFRLMTWQHIPENAQYAEKQSQIAEESIDDDDIIEIEEVKMSKKHVRVNFPPFEHYRINEDSVPYLVGRSHWKGDLTTGHFSKDHGTMTRELAMMFMKLCDRYASRGNWRGYTYNDEMKGQALLHLTQIGLQFDESKSSNPFSYYTQSLTNSFTRVLNIEKRHQNIRDDILELNNYNPSYTRQGEWRYSEE